MVIPYEAAFLDRYSVRAGQVNERDEQTPSEPALKGLRHPSKNRDGLTKCGKAQRRKTDVPS